MGESAFVDDAKEERQHVARRGHRPERKSSESSVERYGAAITHAYARSKRKEKLEDCSMSKTANVIHRNVIQADEEARARARMCVLEIECRPEKKKSTSEVAASSFHRRGNPRSVLRSALAMTRQPQLRRHRREQNAAKIANPRD